MMEYFDFNDEKVVEDTMSINKNSNIFRVSTRTDREVESLVNFIDKKIKDN